VSHARIRTVDPADGHPGFAWVAKIPSLKGEYRPGAEVPENIPEAFYPARPEDPECAAQGLVLVQGGRIADVFLVPPDGAEEHKAALVARFGVNIHAEGGAIPAGGQP